MRREALDETLFFREHRLLPRIGGLAIGFPHRPLALIKIVVAGIGRDLAAIDLGNPRDETVHELAIVRGHEQRPGRRLQKVFEPDD